MGKIWTKFLKWLIYPVFDFINDSRLETNGKIDSLNGKIDSLNGKIDSLNGKIDSLNGKIDSSNNTLDYINVVVNGIRSEQTNVIKNAEHLLSDYYIHKKKIILLGSPMPYNNIGDHAIAVGTAEFIKKYFEDYIFIEMNIEETIEHYDFIRNICNDDDIILLQGGGNLGNLYLTEESLRRRVVDDFVNNLVVIMPQTAYYNEDGLKILSETKNIFNRHKKLLIFTRGKKSLNLCNSNFTNSENYCMLDMALMLKSEYDYDRNGILLCFRAEDDEWGICDSVVKDVMSCVMSMDPNYDVIDHHCKDFLKESRSFELYNFFKIYSKHKVVITDRLHGIIFSIITKTPCVVLRNSYYKNEEFADLFSDSNAVFFIGTDTSDIEGVIKQAINIKKPVYPLLEKGTFDQMAKIIRSKIM